MDIIITVTKKSLFCLTLCFAFIGCSHAPQHETALLIETPQQETLQEVPQDTHHCYFIPPQGWDLADQTKLSPRVKICFLGKSSKNLLPSVNLATEEVDVSLKAYLDIVKKDCDNDPNTHWRDLGKYNTPLGEGRLTEREVKTEWGDSRQIQLIVIKDQTAYILTAGAHKEEFSRYYKDFEAVLRSLDVADDLTASLPSEEKRSVLRELIENLQSDFKNARDKVASEEDAFNHFQQESWEPFQQKVINDFTEMGPYWQILLLRDLQYQLLKRPA